MASTWLVGCSFVLWFACVFESSLNWIMKKSNTQNCADFNSNPFSTSKAKNNWTNRNSKSALLAALRCATAATIRSFVVRKLQNCTSSKPQTGIESQARRLAGGSLFRLACVTAFADDAIQVQTSSACKQSSRRMQTQLRANFDCSTHRLEAIMQTQTSFLFRARKVWYFAALLANCARNNCCRKQVSGRKSGSQVSS